MSNNFFIISKIKEYEMKMLVAYDIKNNKNRRKIQKLLYQFSDSYQKSALEIEMNKNRMKYLVDSLNYFSEEDDLIGFFNFSDVINLGKSQKVEFLI